MKNLTTLSVTCTFCKVEHFLPVSDAQITRYMQGASVQDAFPQLDVNQRELIISKTCGTCWDAMMPEEEEELSLDSACITCHKLLPQESIERNEDTCEDCYQEELQHYHNNFAISEPKVMKSNAGYYIGRSQDGIPYDRLSGYYASNEEAMIALKYHAQYVKEE